LSDTIILIITGKIIAEKVRQYFDAKFKQKGTLLGKLMLKNQTLLQQLRKSEHTISHRQDGGPIQSWHSSLA